MPDRMPGYIEPFQEASSSLQRPRNASRIWGSSERASNEAPPPAYIVPGIFESIPVPQSNLPILQPIPSPSKGVPQISSDQSTLLESGGRVEEQVMKHHRQPTSFLVSLNQFRCHNPIFRTHNQHPPPQSSLPPLPRLLQARCSW